MNVMRKLLIFKYASWIGALIGGIIGSGIYIAYKYWMPVHSAFSYILLLFTVILIFIGFYSGKLIHKLHGKATRDQLTHLLNRRHFYAKIKKELRILKRTKTSLCLALIDIDDFKNVNDTSGHSAGDEVLREVASILERNTREIDTVIRWGGDEFVIIFPKIDLAGASIIAERLRAEVEKNCKCSETTISVGILLVESEMEVSQIVTLVDKALYRAKNTKNLVVSTTCS